MSTLLPLLADYEKSHLSERQPLPDRYLGLSDEEMDARIAAARKTLGRRLVILGHHYQRDEVIQHADFTGDSFKLAQLAATRPEADFIVFCGVHFMAESADILAADHQQVVLPDLNAGCTMADMAEIDQVEDCWDEVTAAVGDDVLPVTYMNSTAALKAFVGRHGGAVCTSSNCRAVLDWANPLTVPSKKFSRMSARVTFPLPGRNRNTAWCSRPRKAGRLCSRNRRGLSEGIGKKTIGNG